MAHSVIGIDLGTTSSCVAVLGRPCVIPSTRRRLRTTPSIRWSAFARVEVRSARSQRRGRRRRRSPHHPIGQAPYGHRLVSQHRRQEVPCGKWRPRPPAAGRRLTWVATYCERCHHLVPSNCWRCRQSHQGSGRRGSDRRPHHQRAHRGGVPASTGRQGAERPRLRPRRWHVRRFAAGHLRRCLQSRPPRATTVWAATTGISGLSIGW